MQSTQEIAERLNLSRRENLERISRMSRRERMEKSIAYSNEEPGDLNRMDGYNCPECLNRGFIWEFEEQPPYIEGGEPVYSERTRLCKCMNVRANIRRMKQSGLEPIIEKCTFEKYEATEEWQQVLKAAAIKFTKNADDLECKWFFMGGGVGSGKTHLCTAIAREMLYKGREVRYMLWEADGKKLKSIINDIEAYQNMIEPFKNAEVLYIDDLFKPTKDKDGQIAQPTSGDIKLAYEIINHRYQKPGSITIISSERHIAEIIELDNAVGSRIYEMTKQNAYNISKDADRNYRIRDMKVI